MKARIKDVIQYLILFGIAGILLWLAVGSIEVTDGESKLGFILSVWNSSYKPYLLLSGALAIVSHLIRAERWRLIMRTDGHQLRLDHSFYSVMVGYFVNLAIPRGGELSRCYNLYRLNRTPIDYSFGTVLAERVVDLLILLSLISFSLISEYNSILLLFEKVPGVETAALSLWEKLLIIGVVLLTFLTVILIFRLVFRQHWDNLKKRFIRLLGGIRSGLSAIFSMKAKWSFLLYSVLIWVLYFLMSYFIILAFEETSMLSLMDTLTIFVIGGIAMALPLPGGTGSYHVLVPLGLVTLFGIAREHAVAFSFIFHGWQTLIVIAFGLFSLLASQYLSKQNKK